MRYYAGVLGMRRVAVQSGFTLIELMVVMLIISVLSYLGMTAFYVYRSDAAYSVVQSVMRNSRVIVEASLNDLDNPPLTTNLVQNVAGPIVDAAGKTYLPGMQLPRNVKLSAQYDPTCTVAGCQSDFLEVKHCLGHEYTQWVRFGDGAEANMAHIAGVGCQ